MTPAVFISYASQDADDARIIRDSLKAAGVEVWFDQSELRGGVEWDREIRAQIRSCALFVPLITTAALARQEGYFRLEWNLAEQRAQMMGRHRLFILPVCTDAKVNAHADVPDAFMRVHWTQLNNDEARRAFAERVRQLISADADQPRKQDLEQSAHGAPAVPVQPTRTPANRWLWVTALVVAFAVAAAFLVLVKNRKHEGPASAQMTSPGAADAESSIAVLPFLDLSEKKDQEYFSDGLSDELIEQLGQTRGLKVIARTSSFFFKGKQVTIADIARALGVTHVVEGSVRKAGNRVRVTAELVKASDGSHLWSQTFDRELDDIFHVQDEISAAVASALSQKFGIPLSYVSGSVTEVKSAAYDQFLLGLAVEKDQISASGCSKAIVEFRKAIELDPGYARPYAEISKCDTWLVSHDRWSESLAAEAEAYANRAVTLAPATAAGYFARAYFRVWGVLDAQGALQDVDKALAIAPSDTETWRRRGDVLSILGKLPEAVAAERKAVDLDPLSGLGWSYLGVVLCYNGEYLESRKAFERQIALGTVFDPDWEQSNLDLLDGHAESVLTKVAKSPNSGPDALRAMAMAQYTLGNAAAAAKTLQELQNKFADRAAFEIAEVLAWTGRQAESFSWLQRAVRQRDSEMASLRVSPFLKSLHSDSRFVELAQQLKLY